MQEGAVVPMVQQWQQQFLHSGLLFPGKLTQHRSYVLGRVQQRRNVRIRFSELENVLRSELPLRRQFKLLVHVLDTGGRQPELRVCLV